MKASTKRRKQLETVSGWLAKARPDLEEQLRTGDGNPEFSLLIALEQFVKYAQMVEEELKQMDKSFARVTPGLRRYTFRDVFDYSPSTDIIVPKYRMVINDHISEAAVPIRNGDWSGLNLFKHIGKDFVGTWDKTTETLTITGIYS